MSEEVQLADNAMKVLLVDDDHQQFLLIGYLLSEITHAEYRLIWCDDLEKALVHIEHQQCDVVLLDYHWAQSGQMFIKRAQQLPHRIPIILMTDGMESEVDRIAIRSGASDYLVKDTVTPELLERAIRYSIERKKAEQHLDYLAHYDFLTGLPNRLLFRDRLNQAIHLSQRTKKYFTLMYIDLNDFKVVNDSYGHSVGDLLLKEFALRLTSTVRRSDTVARIGGDEFTIILNDMGSTPRIIYIAQKLLEKMAAPFLIQKNKLEVGCSIGIATYPDMGLCADSLQRNADMAMYQAKKTGVSSYRFFSVADEANLPIKVSSVEEVREAIENKKLTLVYAPRVNIKTGRVTAITVDVACCYGDAEDRIYPSFMRHMTNHEAILYLSQWIVSQSLKELGDVCKKHDLTLAYPVRRFSLLSRKFFDSVKLSVDEAGVDISSLEFSKLKSTDVEESVVTYECIENVNNSGAKASINVFGDKPLNFSLMRNYDVSNFYMDSSLFQSAESNKKDANLIEAIISLAHKLEVKIIVGNVSKQSQLENIKSLGVDQIQGSVLGKTMNFQDTNAYIEGKNYTNQIELVVDEG